MLKREIIDRIHMTLDKIRPFLKREGGDIDFVGYEDGIVYVTMLGACTDCNLLDSTLNDGIQIILMEEIPEVIGVELATPEIIEKFIQAK